MRFKLTLILLLANLVVFFALWRLGRETEPPVQQHGLISAELTEPDHIEIANRQTNETNVLERTDDTWRIIKPVQWTANGSLVSGLISQLLFLEDKDSFPISDPWAGGSTLASYGLDDQQPSQPHLLVTISKGSHTEKLWIGNVTAANYLYVRDSVDNLIHTVPVELLQSFDVSTKDLRDEKIFTIDNFYIQSIKVRVTNPAAAGGGPTPDVVLPVTLNKDGQKWTIDNVGVTSPADAGAVNDVVSKLTSLTAERFLTKDEQDPARQFTNPFMTIEIDGTEGQQQKLVLGSLVPNAPDQYYARLEDPKQGDTPTVFIVKAQAFKNLVNARESLREHHFLNFDPAKVSGITIDAGAAEVRLEKLETGADPWRVADNQKTASGAPANIVADTALIAGLLDNLRKLEAQSFASDDPSTDDRRSYGLTDPISKVTLTLNADKPITLLLGNGGGITFYAQVDGQNSVYGLAPAVGIDLLSQLKTNPLYYRNRTLESLLPGEQITSLQLTQLNDDGTDAKSIFNFSPDVSSADYAKDTAWQAYLESRQELTPAQRDAAKGLEQSLRNFKVDSYVQESFTDHFQLDADSKTPIPVPWRYRLDAGILLPAAGQPPSQQTLTFYFSERLAGSTQFGGTRKPEMIFKLPYPTIANLDTLTINQTPPPLVQKAIEESAQPIDAHPAPAPVSPPPSPAPASEAIAPLPPPAANSVPAAPPGVSGNIVTPNPSPPSPSAP